MPWDLVALPALLFLLIGLRKGLREAREVHED